MLRQALVIGLCSLLLACSGEGPSGIARGPYTVLEVFDGDSFNLKSASGQTIRIRLAGIDAPEKSQPYSAQSRMSLERLLQSGAITLEPIKKDQFDRWIAKVLVGNQDVGFTQIELGYAWFFTRYRRDLPEETQNLYAQAEGRAKSEKKGLWGWSGPIEPPWKFREKMRKEKSSSWFNPRALPAV